MSSERWISLKKLVEETGLATRTLQYIAQREPGVLVVRTQDKMVEYCQPHCAVNLRQRERSLGAKDERARWMGKETAGGRGDPLKRKLEADARKAEIEVEQLEKSSVPVAHAMALFDGVLTNIRAVLIPFARVAAPKLIGVASIAEMEQAIHKLILRVMEQLATPELVPSLASLAQKASPSESKSEPAGNPLRVPQKRKRRSKAKGPLAQARATADE